MTLIRDLAILIVASAVGGLTAAAAGQPVLLGYLGAGAVCGPGGLGLIEEMIQVETVAQLGVVFLLFGLGLEFDGRRVRRVRAPALGGTALATAMLAALGSALAAAGGAPRAAGAFAGAYVSQSSTALVVKCLQDARATSAPHGELMLALLIVQDVLLGVMLSLLPAFGSADDGDASGGDGAAFLGGAATAPGSAVGGSGGGAGGGASAAVARSAARAAAALLLALGGAAAGARHGGPRRALERLAARGASGPEHAQLALCGACLAAALAGDAAGLSLEVGAFAGGLLLSDNAATAAPPAAGASAKQPHSTHSALGAIGHALHIGAAGAVGAIAPASSHDHDDDAAHASAEHAAAHGSHGVGAHLDGVRTFFGALFLAAVGMTMHFGFLWAHKGVLIAAAMGIALTKTAVMGAALAAWGVPRRTALACALGLANVGELGFVLLSRARGLGVISRPLFLLLVGTTALSLWATPAVFATGVRRAARGGGGGGGGRGDARSSGVSFGYEGSGRSGGGSLEEGGLSSAQRGAAGLRARETRHTLAP
jgi:Kef-type K+ transport system membrane component KefB